MYRFSIVLSLLVFGACQEKSPEITAQQIVDRSIENACQGNCKGATISFTFRDKSYRSERHGGAYQMERLFSDSLGQYRDVLTNEGFRRYLNDSLVQLPDSMAVKYSNSVNSVHYFAQLPFGLNDPAVHKELLGEALIKEQPYYEVGVTFSEEGGGTDFEDKFVYWIHKEDYTVDYLAYSYATDGGGIRFREAYNPRVENGIRFVDYNNYKEAELSTPLTELDTRFAEDQLKMLSKIETENIAVEIQQ